MKAVDIKFALMYHFVFNRNMLAAQECLNEDVIALKGNFIYTCEVKVSKSDLWHGEARKPKHKEWLLGKSVYAILPNMFYMCVPKELVSEAVKWCKTTNPKYGVVQYVDRFNIQVIRRAKYLHKERMKEHIIRAIWRKVCSQYILLKERQLYEQS